MAHDVQAKGARSGNRFQNPEWSIADLATKWLTPSSNVRGRPLLNFGKDGAGVTNVKNTLGPIVFETPRGPPLVPHRIGHRCCCYVATTL